MERFRHPNSSMQQHQKPAADLRLKCDAKSWKIGNIPIPREGESDANEQLSKELDPVCLIVLSAAFCVFCLWALNWTNPDEPNSKLSKLIDKKLKECRSNFDEDNRMYLNEELAANARREILVYTMMLYHSFEYERFNKSTILMPESSSVVVWLKINLFTVQGSFNDSFNDSYIYCRIKTVVARLTLEMEAGNKEKLKKFSELKMESRDPLLERGPPCDLEHLLKKYKVKEDKFMEYVDKFIKGYLAERYVPVLQKCFDNPAT